MGIATARAGSGIRARLVGVIALVAIGAVLLAACGGDDSSKATKSSKSTTTTAAVSTTTTAAPTTSTAAPPTTAPPTTAPATTVAGCRDAVCAVAAWLAGEGHGYAGDCASTTTDQIPQWCSSLHTDGATQKVYYVGPVFSEVAKILTVTEGGGIWTVTNTENPPPLGGG
jgi:hypothetical protein